MKRIALAFLALSSPFLFAEAGRTRPQDESARPQEEMNPDARAAIVRALDWLARRQDPSGALPGDTPICSTSMACLAFMAEGSAPQQGRYAARVRGGLRYIRSKVGRSGFISADRNDGMYGHGYGTLFLAEVVGMISDPKEMEETRDALKRAVSLLEQTQNQFGGWNATPDPNATDDGSGAIAIMEIMALRAARNAGIQVRGETIRRAKKYLLEMMASDGWFAYNYNSRAIGKRSSARTGAGTYMFGAMDLQADARYEKGIQNLMNSAPFLGKTSVEDAWATWFQFAVFYTSLAIYQHGGEEWRLWFRALRDTLVKTQTSEGTWAGDKYGGLFTAFLVLALEMPHRYLPLFQEGGRGAEGN